MDIELKGKMFKYTFVVCFCFCVNKVLSENFGNEACKSCVRVEECPMFQEMDKEDQDNWVKKYPCDIPIRTTMLYDGFSSIAKGDHICCPKKVLNVEDDETQMIHREINNPNTNIGNVAKNNGLNDDQFNPNRQQIEINRNQKEYNIESEQNCNNLPHGHKRIYKRQISINPNNPQTENQFLVNTPINPNQVPQNPNNGYRNDNTGNMGQQCGVQTSLPPDPETGCCGRDTSDADRITDLENYLNPAPPTATERFFIPRQVNSPQQIQTPVVVGPNNNAGVQYVADIQNYASTLPPAAPTRPRINWQQYFIPRQVNPPQTRSARQANVPVNNGVPLMTNIAGGNETALDQFPWTALLEITFNYGDREVSYNCGGSLISSRYILTAAHCVYEAGAQITDLQVILSEYDKRTFPTDCVTVLGEGQVCIQNVVIPVEAVIIHPQYEDARLLNDIALIRLRGFAPYTRFIRPICLAAINIDIPNFTNLPLAVTGWGRDQQLVSEVKQSTVLNLIPNEQCRIYYPNLERDHLCAAGRTGQDTCKGDSGGPLMILYRGTYYVMGVVSGKRADTPCGSSIPSLFTNVFNYLDWIQSVVNS